MQKRRQAHTLLSSAVISLCSMWGNVAVTASAEERTRRDLNTEDVPHTSGEHLFTLARVWTCEPDDRGNKLKRALNNRVYTPGQIDLFQPHTRADFLFNSVKPLGVHTSLLVPTSHESHLPLQPYPCSRACGAAQINFWQKVLISASFGIFPLLSSRISQPGEGCERL